jgi:hypothetical protein
MVSLGQTGPQNDVLQGENKHPSANTATGNTPVTKAPAKSTVHFAMLRGRRVSMKFSLPAFVGF